MAKTTATKKKLLSPLNGLNRLRVYAFFWGGVGVGNVLKRLKSFIGLLKYDAVKGECGICQGN